MELQQLPHELLAKIADELTSYRDLTSFSLVSKGFQAAALPALYRSVTLTVDEKDLQGYNAKEISTARAKGHLGHARSLTLRAALRDNLEHRGRCFHAALPLNENRGKSSEDRLAGNLLSVIEACRDGSLLDFRNLESIRLFTDPRCDEMRHGVTLDGLGLQAFSKLKRLSWTGMFGNNVEYLESMLEGIGHQLEMLDLDFSYCRSPERTVVDGVLDEDVLFEDYVNMGVYRSLLSRVFQLHQPAPLSLPALRDLRLCAVDVEPSDVEGLLGSVDFACLESLEVRACGNSWLILDRLTASASSSSSSPRLLLENLRSFALQVPDNIGVVFWTGVLPFLQSFRGLRDLFLDMPTNQDTTAEIWRAAAAHHGKTLRRLVYHQRKYDAEAGTEPGSWLRWDQPDLCLMSSDLGNGPEGNPLGSLDLESLGLGCSPKWMVSVT
ncbi:hypothetical protein PG988_006252 [Apiospora saccharicola]